MTEPGGEQPDREAAVRALLSGARRLAGAYQAHAAASGSPCGGCPVCLAVATVRRSHPEVLTHLAEAGTSLLAAVSALADGPGEPDPADRSAPADRPDPAGAEPPVQHIEIDD